MLKKVKLLITIVTALLPIVACDSGSSSSGASTPPYVQNFVAIGNNGAIISSNDGKSWKVEQEGIANFKCITYGKNIYVAGGDYKILTSNDAINWKTVHHFNGSTTPEKFFFNNTIFAAINTYKSEIMFSENGTDWSTIHLNEFRNKHLASGEIIQEFTLLNGEFVLLTNKRRYFVASADFSSWSEVLIDINQDFSTQKIYYINNQEIVLSYSSSKASSQLFIKENNVWSTIALPVATDEKPGIIVNELMHADNKFYVIASFTKNDPTAFRKNRQKILSSNDAKTWKTAYSVDGSHMFGNLASFKDKLFLYQSGVINTSDMNAENWTRVPGLAVYKDTVVANGMIVFVGEKSRIVTSKDGISFKRHTYEYQNYTQNYNNKLISFKGFFYTNNAEYQYDYLKNLCPLDKLSFIKKDPFSDIVGSNGFYLASSTSKPTLFSSTNGSDWKPTNINTGVSIAHGNKTFVILGTNDIRFSTDGTTWSAAKEISTNILTDLAYGNGTFVAVGNQGTVIRSTDAETWTVEQIEIPSGLTRTDIKEILFTGEKFVAIAGDCLMISDKNGQNWKAFSCYSPASIAYKNGIFVYVDYLGRMSFSSDAIKWNEIKIPTKNQIYSVGARQ